ncbi:MAG: peptidase [Acidobacteria bacterium]|nr:peptidase [Acidobacteriota bacterium]
MNKLHMLFVLPLIVLFSGCSRSSSQDPAASPKTREVVPDIGERITKLPQTVIDYDRDLLNAEEQQVVAKLIEASRYMDEIFLRQVSEDNPAVRKDLAALAENSAGHRLGLRYFDMMMGRWDRLLDDEPFISPFGSAGAKPEGVGFYPPDMSREAFEDWITANPNDRENFQNLYTAIRRKGEDLIAVPYSELYRDCLAPAAEKLREAAAITQNASLKNFLLKRADAFLSNSYYDSDVAWVEMDSPIEVVIGPYEVYEDALFNAKASFESFVTVVDRPESEKLKIYLKHLADMEKSLPMPDKYKNLDRAAGSAIKVVQEIFTAGDARRGVQTAAFNLPNDEKIRQSKGSKNVLLKNVMQAKFRQSGEPIARRVLDPSQSHLLSFDAYFNHTLFHELSHALGPGIIKGPDGLMQENRLYLKALYSPIEECKADVVGIWTLLWAMDQNLITSFDAPKLFVTDAGLLFRSMRFGIGEAHGGGSALQWNWYRKKGAIMPAVDGRFKINAQKYREAVRTLAEELLMIEATGDYARAERLLNEYAKSTPEIESMIPRLKDIPVDITPVFAAAGEKEQ